MFPFHVKLLMLFRMKCWSSSVYASVSVDSSSAVPVIALILDGFSFSLDISQSSAMLYKREV